MAGADDGPEAPDGTCGGFAQDRLELGKELFDWIETGTVGRKVDENCTAGLDCVADAMTIATFEGRGAYLFRGHVGPTPQ